MRPYIMMILRLRPGTVYRYTDHVIAFAARPGLQGAWLAMNRLIGVFYMAIRSYSEPCSR